MKEVNIISKVVGRSGAEASPSSVAITPNMSGYATKTELNTLRNEFKDFLEGADADVIINKWQDLVSFLEGISEDFDLLSMLGLKADKSELSNYVTLATEQTISAHKNFLNGLSIGGLGITKSQDDVIYLDANLVVRGGITMFGTNSVDVPTIMDAIAVDGKTISKDNGYLEVIGGTGGGLTEVYWDDVIGKPTLLSSFIDDVGYLQKSGGQMTGGIGYTLTPDSYEVGIPAAGTIDSLAGLDKLNSYKSFLGSVYTDDWYYALSIRHRNGSDDGNKYGLLLYTNFSSSANLEWNRQENGIWKGSRVILDSHNWSQYVTAADGGSYLPLSGGRISNEGTGLYINRTTSGSNPHITFESQGAARGDIGVGYEGNPMFYSYGYEGLDRGWHRIFVDGGAGYTLNQASWGNGLKLNRTVANGGAGISSYTQGTFLGTFGINGKREFEFSNNLDITVFTITGSGNVLAYGGITMYSDIRKKTKLQDVELTLQQIAEAPLIEHYYNSDDKRTTHVGSIAQYWAGLNDWFCKLDPEGFYTMEIQNAALASAISIARELVKYESKTDKEIRMLKDEVKRLKKEIKILKSA